MKEVLLAVVSFIAAVAVVIIFVALGKCGFSLCLCSKVRCGQNTTLFRLLSVYVTVVFISNITDPIYFFRLVPSVGPDFKQIQVHQRLAEQCQGVEQSPSR